MQGTGCAAAGLLLFEGVLQGILAHHFLAESVRTRFIGFDCADEFHLVFAAGFAQRCNYFLCHVSLFNFLVNGVTPQQGIKFPDFHASWGILFILGGDVPAGAWQSGFLVLCALQNYLYPVSFFCHLGFALKNLRFVDVFNT